MAFVFNTNTRVTEQQSCQDRHSDNHGGFKKRKNCDVKATDTDILILMCYAHRSQACTNKWIMNIDSERYVNVNTIQDHFGELVCDV